MKGGKGNMAVTRRQFVAGMGALAATMGFSSAQVAKITEALAYGNLEGKPKVIWVHGAECTGCSVSLLSLYEDARGTAIRGTDITTLAALQLAAPGEDVLGDMRTLQNNGFNVDPSAYAVNVQDVLVDWIDLQYHETVMTMGGDLAYQSLKANMDYTGGDDPFVLVVEGAVQDKDLAGAWGKASSHPWCSVGANDAGTDELSFDDVVQSLAERADCAAVITIGQCAAFGGYPAAVSPEFVNAVGAPINPVTGLADGTSDNMGRQTGAFGVYDFLVHKGSAAADKVVNVPGCPTNPWWFVLTVVCLLVDLQATLGTTDVTGPLGILGDAAGGLPQIVGGVDHSRRLQAVYGTPLHGAACARYKYWTNGVFAENPGDPGCLQLIGCKGPHTNSTCGVHGWNGQQPENRRGTASVDSHGVAEYGKKQGGNCIMAGHPCMGCTEPGYPDKFVPFVLR
jgi:hydrogenase small subunit